MKEKTRMNLRFQNFKFPGDFLFNQKFIGFFLQYPFFGQPDPSGDTHNDQGYPESVDDGIEFIPVKPDLIIGQVCSDMDIKIADGIGDKQVDEEEDKKRGQQAGNFSVVEKIRNYLVHKKIRRKHKCREKECDILKQFGQGTHVLCLFKPTNQNILQRKVQKEYHPESKMPSQPI
jgi:hypothetical protein